MIKILIHNRVFKISLHILFIPSFVLLGLFIGQTFQLRTQIQEISNQKAVYDKQIATTKEELNAVLNDQAQLLETTKQEYKKEESSIYSPLLEGKQVEISTYKYKTKNIIRKRIEIDDYSGVEMWEYASEYYPSDGPKDFAIFGGYENYANRATSVDDIKKNWKDSYKTKNGIEMYYEYDYAPKSIGVVLLDSYFSYFPNYRYSKPTLIQIWYSKIGGFPSIKDDPLVLEAKKELNKIADSFELVKSN